MRSRKYSGGILFIIAMSVPALACAAPAVPVAPTATAVMAPASLADEVRSLRGSDTSGDPAAVLRRADDVLARAVRTRGIDPVDILYARAVRASALSALDRTEEALAAFQAVDQELEHRGVPMNPDRASLVLHIGSELGALGRLDEALATTRRALALAERTAGHQSPEYAEALYGLALLDYQAGRQNDAIPLIVEALGIAKAHAERTGENLDAPATYGVTLAALQLNVSDAETAVVTARSAAAWADAHLPEDHRIRVTAAQQLGAILSEAGLYGQAIPILRATLEKRRAILPASDPKVAMSFHALAFALDNAGMRAEAKPLYDAAIALFEANPDRLQAKGLSTMIGQRARMAQWDGDRDGALALRRKALAIAHGAASPEDQTVLTAEYNLAATLVDADRYDEAIPLLDHARAGFLKGTSAVNKRRILAAALTARVAAHRGETAAALAQLRTDLAPLRTRLLDRATARQDVLAMLAEFRQPFMTQARLAIDNGAQDDAFDALQIANIGDLQGAFSSLAVLQDDYGPQARAAIRDYLTLAARGRQLRKSLDQALIAASGQEAVATLNTRIAEVEAHLRETDRKLGTLVPGFTALTAVEPARLADTQARLKVGEGIVLIGADDRGLVTMLVTRDGVAAGVTAVAPRRLHVLEQRLRASVDAGLLDRTGSRFDRQAAHELYNLLFPAAIRPLLKRTPELRIHAPGSLAALPFSALVTRAPVGSDSDPAALRKTAWLIRDHAVSIMISAAPLPSRSASIGSDSTFAGIGAPVLNARLTAQNRSGDLRAAAISRAISQLGELPGAADELRGMARQFGPGSKLLLGADATERAVKEASLENARVIAFATHGLVGGALRGIVEPALVLSAPATPNALDDGLLTASEVAQLRLDADWVILSACDTDAGESENAPTYSGLARAFISAGARSLLLSHWPVRDDLAGRLTLRTLDLSRAGQSRTGQSRAGQTRAGLSRAQALRRAQLELLRDTTVEGGAHPVSWAPFVLIGQ